MNDECTCMCAEAGHYGICRVVSEPGLDLAWSRYLVVPGGGVCRACFNAVVPMRWPRPVPAAVG
jgi:hypothetical protein